MNSRMSKFAMSICTWICAERFLGPSVLTVMPRFGARSTTPIWLSTERAFRTL